MDIIRTQPNSIGPEELLKRDGPPPVPSAFNAHLSSTENVVIKENFVSYMDSLRNNSKFYTIFLNENEDQEILYAKRETAVCNECFCDPLRPPLVIEIGDTQKNVVATLIGFNTWCAHQMLIKTPEGNQIGFLVETFSWSGAIHVKDEEDNLIFIVKSNCCACRCTEIEYSIYSSNGLDECGSIVKTSGWTRASRKLQINFPLNASVPQKILLLAAAFFLEYIVEKRRKNAANANN